MQFFKQHDVKPLCRACLQSLVKESINCSTIKHDIFQAADLAKKFVLCTSLNCEPTDGLPKYLCDCCYNKLNDFHQFRAKCIESAKRFETIRKSTNDENLENELVAQPNVKMNIDEPVCIFQSNAFKTKNAIDLEAQTDIEFTVYVPPGMFHSEDIGLENEDAVEDKHELNNDAKLEKVKRKGGMQKGRRSENTKRTCATVVKKIKTDSGEKPADKLRRGRSRSVVPIVTDNSPSENEIDFEHTFEETGEKRNTDIPKVKISKKNASNDLKSENREKRLFLQCDVCSLRFVAEHRLIAHKRDHEGLVPYPCPRDGCERGFRNWVGLSEHLKKHDPRNLMFNCSKHGCDKVFSSQRSLATHQRTFHRKKYTCETCGKGYRTMLLLNSHSYSHKDNSEFPHVCEQCKQRFIHKRSLTFHLLRHAGVKNYICPHCGESKTTPYELKYHINNHTLERRWPCRLCTCVFTKAVNLNRHIKTVHELVKNYVCHYCERSFATKISLMFHEMIHTGAKPHECQECGKRFRLLAHLVAHVKNIHKGVRKATTIRSSPLVATDNGIKGDAAPVERKTDA